uniref:Reverse transcriptase domain-containing protein n=1 Tax=Kryptolebias marmoratus TaxID=37003 RepID=A0A3Q3ARB5_KRYMA
GWFRPFKQSRGLPFTIKAGVRQGCPLSPLLFVLAMEPLACAIRKTKAIKGIIPPGNLGKDIKLTIYMDNLTLLLTNNFSIFESLKLCDKFMAASNMRVNKQKSEILYNNWKEIKEKWGLSEKIDTIKVLGIQIGKNMEQTNWKEKLPKIQGKLLKWMDRDLSFTGKVLIIKTEVISTLAFLAATFPFPCRIVRSVRKIMFHFLWGSKHEKLKREIMYRPVAKGGRALPEIKSKFDAMFLTPILRACLGLAPEPLWAPEC